MHQAQRYVDLHIRPVAPNGKLSLVALSATQATGLSLALTRDAVDYLYSGTISIGDAVQAVERSLYTWATVKLYYAVFYLSRALLALNGTALVYEGSKPFSVACAPGATPVKRDGPTHKAVLTAFASVLPNTPLLSQPIGATPALEWLMQRREEANYTNARFCEPSAPAHFKVIAHAGVRRSISAYMHDTSYLYTFDPQHAMLAMPIEALKEVIKLFALNGAANLISADDRRYIASLYCDKTGPLPEIVALLKL